MESYSRHTIYDVEAMSSRCSSSVVNVENSQQEGLFICALVSTSSQVLYMSTDKLGSYRCSPQESVKLLKKETIRLYWTWKTLTKFPILNFTAVGKY